MVKKRIVVTGMGLVSCFGTDVEHFYSQLLSGKSGIVPIEKVKSRIVCTFPLLAF